MIGPGVGDRDLAARHADGGQVGGGDHPVGDDRMVGGRSDFDALDLNA